MVCCVGCGEAQSLGCGKGIGHQNGPSMPKPCCCLGRGYTIAENCLKEASKKRVEGEENKGLDGRNKDRLVL